MDTTFDAVFSSWDLNLWIVIPALIVLLVYIRGWRRLRRRDSERFDLAKLVSFAAGLLAILLALTSPLDAFAGWLLTVHMIQHLLLIMVAPPLLLYGAPYLPLLSGLPRAFVKDAVGPFLASPILRRVSRSITHPVFCWSAFVVTNIAWHLPPMYELALHSAGWHQVEHLCFLTAALLFWWPVVRPFPFISPWPRWAIVPYLFLGDLQNTALSAFLTFTDRVLYPTYQTAPRISSLSALDDQSAAGALMWVAGSIFFLVPVGLITIELLTTRKLTSRSRSIPGDQTAMLEESADRRGPLDLLKLPLIGPVLRWPYFRRAAQLLTFALALLVMADGLWGHQMSSMNLAGVLPWIHWRGAGVLALLAVGNVFCMACPFNLVRDLGRKLLPARWSWPRRLRSKWIAIGLLLIFFWAYEAFSLWDSPRWTALLIVGYFAAALIVDGLFKGASFCKYVCPIGQYQVIQSLISPVEVGVRNRGVCGSCTTHDCLRGNENQRGCELQLFQPQKAGNMDCTFCLDCVHACPHQNVSLLASLPASQLVRIEPRRRSIRWFRRLDGAVLIFLLVFAAFINAGVMVESAQMWELSVQARLGFASTQPILTVLFLLALIVIPFILVGSCVWFARTLSGVTIKWRESVSTFALAFVPLGFSMWLFHFSYHLFTGWKTAWPVFQHAAREAGFTIFGAPDWSGAGTMAALDWLPSFQLFVLGLGLLLTLYTGWRLAERYRLGFARTLAMLAPWAGLAMALYAFGMWVIFQPMQMRGMLMTGGMN